MIKTIIIADDTTGANASAILLNQLSFKTLSCIEFNEHVNIEPFDAIAIGTDSRAINPQEAYNRVINTLTSVKHVQPLLYNKRIDSTLRGNLGSEIEAFLTFLPHKKAAVVPSYPNSKRICKDGIIYVDGKILEDTDVAKDPKMPIHSSVAKDLILKQSSRSIFNIYLKDIRENMSLTAQIADAFKVHDIVIFDAENNQDIEIISKALVQTHIDVISVDPGPFTFYLSKALLNEKNKNRFVYLVGSVVDTTFEQLKYIHQDPDFDIIYTDPNLLLNPSKVDLEVKRVIRSASLSQKQFLCITTTDIFNRDILNLPMIAQSRGLTTDDISLIINHYLADMLMGIMDSQKISGIFCSGGDTSVGFLRKSGVKGINLITEVLPLSVYGRLVGGKYEGLPIITKGGMIGEKNSYTTIKNFFKEEIFND